MWIFRSIRKFPFYCTCTCMYLLYPTCISIIRLHVAMTLLQSHVHMKIDNCIIPDMCCLFSLLSHRRSELPQTSLKDTILYHKTQMWLDNTEVCTNFIILNIVYRKSGNCRCKNIFIDNGSYKNTLILQ